MKRLKELEAQFCSSPAAAAGRPVIEAERDQIWTSAGEFESILKIKRLRKPITEFEEFWVIVAYDILEMLCSVSLGRSVLDQHNAAVLEAVFATYNAGYYPCGWRKTGQICVFNPRMLEGHKPLSQIVE